MCGVVLLVAASTRSANGGCPCGKTWPHLICHYHASSHATGPGDIINEDFGGTWYWMRSPEQEKRVVMGLFNRYCIRCHGVDGRGVWDIPDVPDFTNAVWQTTRSDDYRTRVILEGRGAVMPAFRGTLTLEESAAMARYLHIFEPGSTVSRPDATTPAAPAPAAQTARRGNPGGAHAGAGSEYPKSLCPLKNESKRIPDKPHATERERVHRPIVLLCFIPPVATSREVSQSRKPVEFRPKVGQVCAKLILLKHSHLSNPEKSTYPSKSIEHRRRSQPIR